MRWLIILLAFIASTAWGRGGIELLGSFHFGSVYEDVVIEGNYAYFATKWGIEVFELGEEKPRKVGETPTPGDALGVDVEGGYAFIADGYKGLAIIDVSDPTSPRLLTSLELPGRAEEVAVSNGFAYVGVCEEEEEGQWLVIKAELIVVKVTDPMRPERVGSLSMGDIRGIAVSGNLAFISSGDDLLIVDISDPRSPAVISRLKTPAPPWGIEVAGDGLILIACSEAGLISVDVSDPTSPRMLSKTRASPFVCDVAVEGDIAFTGGSGFITAVDVSDPRRLKGLSAWSTKRHGIPGFVSGIDVGRGWLLAADLRSEPTVASFKGKADLEVQPSPGYTGRWLAGVDLLKDHKAVVVGENELIILDISDRRRPRPIATFERTWHGGRVKAWKNYIIAGADFMPIIDISNPQEPRDVDSAGGWTTWRSGMAIHNDLLLIAEGDELRILDLRALRSLGEVKEVASVRLQGARDVAVEGDYAFVARGNDGIAAVKIRKVRATGKPEIVSEIRLVKADKVIPSGRLLFAVDEDSDELSVIDIADLERPRLLSKVELPRHKGYVFDLEVYGKCLLVAELDGLSIFDFSDPSDLKLIGEFDTPMPATDVLVRGEEVYLADSGDLFILRLPPWWKLIDLSPKGRLVTRYGRVKAEGVIGGGERPAKTRLFQNFPNPFNAETWIPFQLAEDSRVKIRIYDPLGRLVREVDLGRLRAGFYTSRGSAARWDGRNRFGEEVPSGLYFYELEAEGFKGVKKLIIVK